MVVDEPAPKPRSFCLWLCVIPIHVSANTMGYAGNGILASPFGFSSTALINVFPVQWLSHWLGPIKGIIWGLSLAANV